MKEILNNQTQNIAEQIMNETSLDKVKDLTHLFNVNMSKKNALRVMAMDNLVDKVTSQIEARFEKYPDNFSNTELLNYLQVLQNSIDKASKNLNLVEESPAIQLNQNNVNINIVDNMSRESRERVAAFLKQALSGQIKNEEESTTIILEEEVEEDDT
jgi:hypothetical protein